MEQIILITIGACRGKWVPASVFRKKLVDARQIEDSPSGTLRLNLTLASMLSRGLIQSLPDHHDVQ